MYFQNELIFFQIEIILYLKNITSDFFNSNLLLLSLFVLFYIILFNTEIAVKNF